MPSTVRSMLIPIPLCPCTEVSFHATQTILLELHLKVILILLISKSSSLLNVISNVSSLLGFKVLLFGLSSVQSIFQTYYPRGSLIKG